MFPFRIKIINKDGKVTSAEFVKYSTFQLDKPIPRREKSWYIRKPQQIFTLSISSPIEDFQPANIYGEMVDSRYKLKTTFDKYDIQNGNLLEYHNEGSCHMAFDYDNQYQFPIIELKNCTYDFYESLLNSNSLIKYQQNDLLKLRKLLPNAQITNYTYDPKFGVTSITTPNGVSTYKEYDEFGRLKFIKDTNQKILKAMEYNYKIQ